MFYMLCINDSYGFCLISTLDPGPSPWLHILLRDDLHQTTPPSIQNSILEWHHQKWKRPASLVVPTDTYNDWNHRLSKGLSLVKVN